MDREKHRDPDAEDALCEMEKWNRTMTDRTPIKTEARLVGLSKQRRKDGDWIEVRFHIHPDDNPAALFILPLGTAVELSIAGPTEAAGEQEDEQAPTLPPEAAKAIERPHRKWQELSAREQSVLRCKQPDFQKWICSGTYVPTEENAAMLVQRKCGVKSRSELDDQTDLGRKAALRWWELENDYHAAKDGINPQTMAEQARMR